MSFCVHMYNGMGAYASLIRVRFLLSALQSSRKWRFRRDLGVLALFIVSSVALKFVYDVNWNDS